MVWAQGQQLQGGKYVIESVLGQGGFGITYKALHVPSNELVVIKTPNEYLQFDPNYDKYIARFIQEGQILARLSQDPHPHIVGVRDLFKDGETHCLVMDFIDGENLFQLVTRRGAIPEAVAVKCIRQIAEALVVVHEAGLVHRDAHPGNIMLRQNGKAVLIDFGIAKGLVPSTKTSTSKAGNEGFAPYEQMVRGSREPTVDVYCLAATLYYAVTGQRPTPALVRRLDNKPLIPPKRIISGVSDQVNQAILKGMALEPKNRPQSMEEWLKLLEVPSVVTPPSDTRKTRIIPWGWLATMLVCYSLIGISLALAATTAAAGAWAVAAAWAAAWAAGEADAATAAVAAGVAGAATVDVAAASVLVMAGAAAGAVAGAVAAAGAGEKLLESFSKFHTFLIVLGTSWLGLGLGWLLSLIYRSIFPS